MDLDSGYRIWEGDGRRWCFYESDDGCDGDDCDGDRGGDDDRDLGLDSGLGSWERRHLW